MEKLKTVSNAYVVIKNIFFFFIWVDGGVSLDITLPKQKVSAFLTVHKVTFSM